MHLCTYLLQSTDLQTVTWCNPNYLMHFYRILMHCLCTVFYPYALFNFFKVHKKVIKVHKNIEKVHKGIDCNYIQSIVFQSIVTKTVHKCIRIRDLLGYLVLFVVYSCGLYKIRI